MKKIIFIAIVAVMLCVFWILPETTYAISNDCEVEIEAAGDTSINKIKYELDEVYDLRLFIPENCNIQIADLNKIIIKYKATSQSPVNFRSDSTGADFFGFGLIWGANRSDDLTCDLSDVISAHKTGFILNNTISNDPIPNVKSYTTDIHTGKVVYQIHTVSIAAASHFSRSEYAAGSDSYFYFKLRLCTPGTGKLYVLHDTSIASAHTALGKTVKRISDEYKVNRGIIERNIDEVPGGPTVAQIMMSLLSGILCWAVSKPLTRTESAEVRGAVIQPIFGCAGMIFGALLMPVFGYGDWFLATFLIILAVAFASLIGVLFTRSP